MLLWQRRCRSLGQQRGCWQPRRRRHVQLTWQQHVVPLLLLLGLVLGLV